MFFGVIFFKLYESRFTLCNVEEGEKKTKTEDEISFLRAGKGIYVGESSRSLYERSKEHQKDREDMNEKSHQIKHWLTDHRELATPPAFR